MKKLLIVLLMCISTPLYAGSWFAPDLAPTSKVDPLILAVRTVWDSDIKTVAEATHWILGPTGYHLTTAYPAPESSIQLAEKPIPPVMKMNRTLPIIDALQLLIGTNNTVIIDRRNHLVSFEKGVES